jgi:hypothetical protein
MDLHLYDMLELLSGSRDGAGRISQVRKGKHAAVIVRRER